MPQFRIIIIPNRMGLMPISTATGSKMGVVIRMMGAISMMQPSSRIRFSSRAITIGLLSTVHNAGLQSGIQLGERNDSFLGTQVSDHTDHDGVLGNADLHALQVFDAVDFNAFLEEEVTEALFAVAQAQIQLLGLVQEILSQIAVGEVPEMLLVDEGVGDGQQLGLVAAVAGQRESGDTGDIDGAALGQDAVQNGSLVAENAVGLNSAVSPFLICCAAGNSGGGRRCSP